MRKLILSLLIIAGCMSAEAQGIRFGIKAGANFANLSGGDIDTENITSWHAGGLVEINAFQNFSIQPELLYSSQGAKVDGADDFKLDYVSVPVLAKFYLITDKLSIEAGPQFSFLVNDDIADTFETKSFDFAVIGGVGFNITNSFFLQGRYVIGLTEVSRDAEATNTVIQLSAGYRF